ncbi:hypothetical protein MRX96_020993 [Rhipicephalus microplus]
MSGVGQGCGISSSPYPLPRRRVCTFIRALMGHRRVQLRYTVWILTGRVYAPTECALTDFRRKSDEVVAARLFACVRARRWRGQSTAQSPGCLDGCRARRHKGSPPSPRLRLRSTPHPKRIVATEMPSPQAFPEQGRPSRRRRGQTRRQNRASLRGKPPEQHLAQDGAPRVNRRPRYGCV